MDMEKEEIKSVPIWIQLSLNFKYWGEKSLFKIVSQLGKPIKRDAATVSRDKLQYARVLVDMPITQKLPDQVSFMNEHSELVQVPITYEWRPTVCDNCKLVGHSTIECRKGKTKRIWVQKKQQVRITQKWWHQRWIRRGFRELSGQSGLDLPIWFQHQLLILSKC
jgi:hypothetical protein